MASSYTFLSYDSSDSDTSLKAQGTGSDTDDELPAIDVSTPKKASVQPQPPVQVYPAPILSSISTPPRPTPPSPQKPHDRYTSRITDCPTVQKTPERKPMESSPSHSRSSLTLGASPSFSLSLHSLSPLRMGTDHARTVDEGRRLAMKAGKLSKNLKQKTETRQKVCLIHHSPKSESSFRVLSPGTGGEGGEESKAIFFVLAATLYQGYICKKRVWFVCKPSTGTE